MKLYDFLENLDTETVVRICDESGALLFDGPAGDVPMRVSSLSRVIKGSVVNIGDHLVITIKKE